MLNTIIKTQFKRDVKRCKKRGKNMNKLKAAIVILQTQGELPDNYLNHQLSENWIDHQECHLEPDWLLIYQMIDNELILTRTGSHSDLFE